MSPQAPKDSGGEAPSLDAPADPKLVALRAQIGPAAWSDRVAEARRQARILEEVLALEAGGLRRADALKSLAEPVTSSTFGAWLAKYRAGGVEALVSRVGRVRQRAEHFPHQVAKPRREGAKEAISFLKWVGSKRQSLPHIRARAPAKFGTYFEPMVGSGVVFFTLRPERAVLGDLNDELMNCYEVVRSHLPELIDALRRHENTYEHFLAVRSQVPEELGEVERAARTIFLNKTCFNGLYRVNAKGRFNVPYGWSRHANLVDVAALERARTALAAATLCRGDVEATVRDAGRGDFVYLDPPYADGGTRTARSFHQYQTEAFDMGQQERLAALCRELHGRGCQVLVSNADVPVVRELYRGFHMEVVPVTRSVSAKTDGRRGWTELLISTFHPVEPASRPRRGARPEPTPGRAQPPRARDAQPTKPPRRRGAQPTAARRRASEPWMLDLGGAPTAEAVHEILFGYGALARAEAMRIVEHELRAAGLLEEVPAQALDRAFAAARQAGLLDRPRSGLVRAIRSDPRSYDPEHWALAVEASQAQREATRLARVARAADWAREHLGLRWGPVSPGDPVFRGLSRALRERRSAR